MVWLQPGSVTVTSASWRIGDSRAAKQCSESSCTGARSTTSRNWPFRRKTLVVFDGDEQRYTAMGLFPDDREILADALDSVQVKLSGLEL